jgi:TubC N-terminal docking domain
MNYEKTNDLIQRCSRAGIILQAHNGYLEVDAPSAILTSELRQELLQYKPAILAILSSACTCNPLPS